jgi:Ca2+-binding RTX toxin-like protein
MLQLLREEGPRAPLKKERLFMRLWTVLILATMMLGVVLLSGVAQALDKAGDSAPNTLRGSNGPDYIRGMGGGDDISGKNGLDHLYGNMGNDLLHGGYGNDFISGDKGDNDVVYGDGGRDELYAESATQGSFQAAKVKGGFQAAKVKGGRKPDKLLGGSGNDTIRAEDGTRDIIRGGPGRDKAYVDRVDKVKGVEKEVVPKQCQDGIDNDGDGKIDYGNSANNDTGCSSATDDTEN